MYFPNGNAKGTIHPEEAKASLVPVESPPGGSQPSTKYHVPPTKRQLELQEKLSLVVTMIERRCWHSVNVSHGCPATCH